MEKLVVLVVDDESGIRSGIIRILKNYSVGFPFMDEDFEYVLHEAATGEEALSFIQENKTDIILLDNKLPGMLGIDVLEYINKNKYDIQVMMITSYASLELAVKATQNGAYNFVPKPFTPQELKSAMENITKHLFLKRMTNKMNEDDKSLRHQFLSVLSHELKSPINAVEGYLNMMQDRQAGNNMDDYAQMLDRSLIRLKGMRSLINDMLDLTRIESGKNNRHIGDVDLFDVAKFAIDTFDPLAKQKNLKVYFDSPENLHINADRQEMEIILNNLISNAIKYNNEGGQINIILKSTVSEITIIVEDTGIGMSADDITKLFHEFVRIKNLNTKNIVGTGLGLSIVKKIVEIYNGTIDVSSTPGKGTTFTINLPR
ncbi:MAG: hybrid sensor histidine kinase/response regulator [Bacteroidota bacterium]